MRCGGGGKVDILEMAERQKEEREVERERERKKGKSEKRLCVYGLGSVELGAALPDKMDWGTCATIGENPNWVLARWNRAVCFLSCGSNNPICRHNISIYPSCIKNRYINSFHPSYMYITMNTHTFQHPLFQIPPCPPSPNNLPSPRNKNKFQL